MNISSNTKLYAVIGDPVEHSLSPTMQNIAFKSLALNSIYLAFRVKSQDLKDAVAGLRSLGVLGFNVTVPHKISIINYLDKIDHQALEIGAVNTVINKDEMLIGYNTDGSGALAALREEGVELKGKKVVLLGAGGAAKALVFTIAPLVESLLILNRTELKAKDLASSFKERPGLDIEGKKLTETSIRKALADTDFLINTTSIGMHPRVNETLVKSAYFHQGMTVFDIIYNPAKTRLLKEAEIAGAHIISGVKMLIHQGALAFELWTSRKPPVNTMYRAVKRVLRGG